MALSQDGLHSESSLAPPKLSSDNPVVLRVVDQKAYLWDVEDIKRLRVDHHICGVLIGTLPQVAQQNVFLGLPLQLLPEEVAILLTHGLAVLVDDTVAHLPPTKEQASKYAAGRLQGIKAQQEAIFTQEMEKEKRMKERYSEQIEKKRREKLEKKRALEGKQEGEQGVFGAEEATEPSSPSSNKGKEKAKEEGTTAAAIAKTAYSITTSTSSSSPSVPWYDPSSLITTLEEARLPRPIVQQIPLSSASSSSRSNLSSSPLFSFPEPEDEMQVARFKVFEDLWKKGYYMGKGLKFGGDYLVYPGDPLRFHSHFSTTVLPTPSSEIPPLDMVSWGRLATAVKKACLLATWNEKIGKVEYLSLEWAGFG